MADLQPGDMCLILDHWTHDDRKRTLVGRTVVLLNIENPLFGSMTPYWRCTNVPKNWVISHAILKRIPPVALDEEEEREDELALI